MNFKLTEISDIETAKDLISKCCYELCKKPCPFGVLYQEPHKSYYSYLGAIIVKVNYLIVDGFSEYLQFFNKIEKSFVTIECKELVLDCVNGLKYLQNASEVKDVKKDVVKEEFDI